MPWEWWWRRCGVWCGAVAAVWRGRWQWAGAGGHTWGPPTGSAFDGPTEGPTDGPTPHLLSPPTLTQTLRLYTLSMFCSRGVCGGALCASCQPRSWPARHPVHLGDEADLGPQLAQRRQGFHADAHVVAHIQHGQRRRTRQQLAHAPCRQPGSRLAAVHRPRHGHRSS